MQYSNIRPRAGLVVLVFALIISFVSAIPIPVTESGLSHTLSHSNPSLNEQDHIQLSLNDRMSTLPIVVRALNRRQHVSTDMEDQLVRRTSIFTKIKHAFQKVGSAIKHGFQKVGSAIKSVAKKVGNGIKTAVQKVGHGIRIAAQKVGHFVKTTGAKIAKFGLKVVQFGGEIIGKVASFIPGIGKPIDQAIDGVSKVAGVISDHIHAKLPGKLQNGMNAMNKGDKIMDYIPRRRDFSEE